jgi:hypothetical protein
MFVMVRGRAPLRYEEQREVWGIKTSAEREVRWRERKGKLRCPRSTTIIPRERGTRYIIGQSHFPFRIM